MSDSYTMWTGHRFSEGGPVVVWPVCVPDPMETVSPDTCMGELPPTYVRGPAPIKTVETAILALVQAIHEQTKAITLLAESNQMLVQAMAEGEGVEEADRYQTL